MANFFTGKAQLVADNLDSACCLALCPPIEELEDNQFLAAVLYALGNVTGIVDWSAVSMDEIKSNNSDTWCALNMQTLCSIPADKLKALILFQLNAAQP